MAKTQSQSGFDAEVRAVEQGHRAFVQVDGSIKVVSDTNAGVSYNVRFFEVPYLDGLVHFVCNCKAGQNREHIPVPCKHAALAGRRLEREKMVAWADGLFYVRADFRNRASAQDATFSAQVGRQLADEPRPVAPPNVSALVD